jgi:hypothetical protein
VLQAICRAGRRELHGFDAVSGPNMLWALARTGFCDRVFLERLAILLIPKVRGTALPAVR